MSHVLSNGRNPDGSRSFRDDGPARARLQGRQGSGGLVFAFGDASDVKAVGAAARPVREIAVTPGMRAGRAKEKRA